MDDNHPIKRKEFANPILEDFVRTAEELVWLQHDGNPIPFVNRPNGFITWEAVIDPEVDAKARVQEAERLEDSIKERYSTTEKLRTVKQELDRNPAHADPYFKYFYFGMSFVKHGTTTEDKQRVFDDTRLPWGEGARGWLQKLETSQQRYMCRTMILMVSSIVGNCGGRAIWMGSNEKDRRSVFAHFFKQYPYQICQLLWGKAAAVIGFEQIWGMHRDRDNIGFWQMYCLRLVTRLAELVYIFAVRPGAIEGVAKKMLDDEWKVLPQKIIAEADYLQVPSRPYEGLKKMEEDGGSVYNRVKKLIEKEGLLAGEGWLV